MHVSEDYGFQCYATQSQKAFFKNNNLKGQINNVFIRQALVDTGSSVNILPLAILTAAGVLTTKVVKSQISINRFGNNSEETMGYIEIDLRISPIRSFTKLYVGWPNHIKWESLKYEDTTHQANEVPKEVKDMPAHVAEDESIQKIMHAPKCMHDKSIALNGEVVLHSTFHPKISSSNKSIHPTVQEREGIRVVLEFPDTINRYVNALATFGSKLTFVEEQPNIAIIRKEAPTIDSSFQDEAPEGDDWRETVRNELSKPSGEHNIKCLNE
ncbi:hypothetical protein D8674_021207 [Pyrus ussuriensis x Pyrus communis]|uniref:Peptidase A2 domain-containing protein n=1 Tax=Pyrus ussuriensis x Pyrus communis TaxID=2448454 RepID=A0A5N5GGJ7_9ROSA|nr:hypothetical protein D8674_021207 [Pyrus ussuriensis x Pyrus communis]